MSMLDRPTEQFINKFMRLNDRSLAVGYNKLSNYQSLDILAGGTRDTPSLKVFHCKSSMDGCSFADTSQYILEKHESKCHITDKIFTRPCSDECCDFVTKSLTE